MIEFTLNTYVKTTQKHDLVYLEPIADQKAEENLTYVIKSRNKRPLKQFILAVIHRTKVTSVIQAVAKFSCHF